MKDRILNGCMLIAVAAAVIATLFSQSAAPEKELLPLTLTAPTAAPTIHPAEAYRAHRRETREQETEALCALMDGGEEEARLLAQSQLLEMAKNAEIELAAEGALTARGYAFALCVSRGGEAVVFVEGPIQERDAALVMAIVESAADIPRENIRVTDYAF